jgi:hypothetical protein
LDEGGPLMKPLTAQSFEGRLLLALRAGPTSNSALVERFGSTSGAYRMVKQGFVVRADGDEGGEFRITAAGRAACPYRNPLAAPGAVKPITEEVTVSPKLTRQEVLDAITSHLVALKRDGFIQSPRRGVWQAVRLETGAEHIAVESITATIPGDRRAPVVFEDIDIEFAVFSSGRVEISDERHTVIIKGFALLQLREFISGYEVRK